MNKLQCDHSSDQYIICNKFGLYQYFNDSRYFNRCEDHRDNRREKFSETCRIKEHEFESLYLNCEHESIILDWLKEHDYTEEVKFLEDYYLIPKELRTLDWCNVFNFSTVETALPNDDVSLKIFRLQDINEIYALNEGDNDSEDWLIVGSLKDERNFFIEADCCYTGWGVSCNHIVVVSNDYNELIMYGMRNIIREKLKLELD